MKQVHWEWVCIDICYHVILGDTTEQITVPTLHPDLENVSELYVGNDFVICQAGMCEYLLVLMDQMMAI